MASSPVVLSSSNERLKASKKPPKSESMITYPELLTTEELENFRRKRHQQIEEHKRDLEEIYKEAEALRKEMVRTRRVVKDPYKGNKDVLIYDIENQKNTRMLMEYVKKNYPPGEKPMFMTCAPMDYVPLPNGKGQTDPLVNLSFRTSLPGAQMDSVPPSYLTKAEFDTMNDNYEVDKEQKKISEIIATLDERDVDDLAVLLPRLQLEEWFLRKEGRDAQDRHSVAMWLKEHAQPAEWDVPPENKVAAEMAGVAEAEKAPKTSSHYQFSLDDFLPAMRHAITRGDRSCMDFYAESASPTFLTKEDIEQHDMVIRYLVWWPNKATYDYVRDKFNKKNTTYTNWDTRELLQLPKYSHQLGRDFDLNQWAMPFDNILQPNELPSIAAVKECSAYKLQQQALEWLAETVNGARGGTSGRDTLVYDRIIVATRESDEMGLSFLDRRDTYDAEEATNAEKYKERFEKFKQEMADAAKNLPRLPPDWIKRKFSDSSVERFLKWVIQKSAEINQQGEKAPLRAVAFLLSVGSYSVGSDNLRRRTYRHCMAGLLILPVMSNELRDSRLMFFEPANKECHFVPDWGKGQSEVELRVPFICGEMMKVIGTEKADLVTGIQGHPLESQANLGQCAWQSLGFIAAAVQFGTYPSCEDVHAIFKVKPETFQGMRPVVYLKREGTALLVDRVRYTEVKQEVNKPARALIKAVTDQKDLTVGFGLPMGFFNNRPENYGSVLAIPSQSVDFVKAHYDKLASLTNIVEGATHKMDGQADVKIRDPTAFDDILCPRGVCPPHRRSNFPETTSMSEQVRLTATNAWIISEVPKTHWSFKKTEELLGYQAMRRGPPVKQDVKQIMSPTHFKVLDLAPIDEDDDSA